MKRLDAGITDLVTVFMKVMVKRRMRGSTRSQSERSTFKIVCQGEHRFSPSTKAWPCRKCLGWMEIELTTGKVSPQEPTLDKRLPSAATTVAELKRSRKDPFLKHLKFNLYRHLSFV